ncbi:MAG TPA: VOC family protein [Bacteroidota bacterium]|nr:VOC family protein [Bacteroidota bacterium]
MKIKLNSVMVDDQDAALSFYTKVLGFVKKTEIPMGEFRWLTVASPDGPGEVELVLEPMGFPPARTYQRALFDAGVPLTAFETDDIRKEFGRLKDLGVVFRGEPASMGTVTSVIFEDTCGNLINLYQVG